jgi:hypothetical protein
MRTSLARLFAESPLKGLNLTLERNPRYRATCQAMTGFLLDTNVPSELTNERYDPRVEAWLPR